MDKRMTDEEAVAYIDETPKFTKKNTLENTRAILRKLGDPQDNMKILHVAGTNGKGSVCAFLSSILTTAGKHTGLFTSPHLVDINERFQIDQEPVSDEAFLEAFHQVMDCVEEIQREGYAHPTYFEILFLIGMVLFAGSRVEYLVLETGLGGRLDATNSIAHPLVCVITSISLEHVEYLGDTIPAIAGEKAGIIKPGVPVVYDATLPEVARVIEDKAREVGAKAYGVRPSMYEILTETNKDIDFSLDSGYYEYRKLKISSVAEYQVMNALEAVTAIHVMDGDGSFTEKIIREGIARMRWQGRMETVMPGVILDGGHNRAGVAEFVKTARRLEENYPVTLLFSAVSDKDYEHMIETICRELHFHTAVITEVGCDRAVPAARLAEYFRRYSKARILECPAAGDALDTALEAKGEDGMLFCVGSLYLVGSIKRELKWRYTVD